LLSADFLFSLAKPDPHCYGEVSEFMVRIYQVSTAKLALLPNDAPTCRLYITQSIQGHWNQTGVSLTPQPVSQDERYPLPQMYHCGFY